jgi:hypothetical protein
MARTRDFPLHSPNARGSRAAKYLKTLIILSYLALAVSNVPSAYGQTQQPFLIAVQTASSQHGTVTFVRDDTTGVLTLLPSSIVNFSNPCSPSKIEPKDRFLFGACDDGLSMYTLDASTGIVAEVQNSPFAASIGNLAELIFAESTGQHVYLLKASSSASTSANSLILDTFQIDAQKLALVPTSSQTLPVAGDPVGAVADPNGHGFAVLLNQNQGGAQPAAVLYVVTFDPSSGLPLLPTSGTNVAGTNAQSIQIGPKGNFMSFNFGPNSEFLTVYRLSTSNFQPLTSSTLNIESVPFSFRGIFYDPTDTLIYVQTLNTNPVSSDYTNFRVLDLTTLTEILSSPISFEQATEVGCGLPDPYGPFVYCDYFPSTGGSPTGLAVYEVDPITGVPSQPSPISVPFSTNLTISPALLTATASQQNSSSPSLAWNPSSLTFSSTQTGQSNGPLGLTFKNIGTLPVTFSSATISGPNATDFSKTDLCTPLVVLQPNNTCTISITYSPSAAGSSQATLTVTDNALGSPQAISLSGTAVAPPPPVPAVSLSPSGTLTFPGTTTQGTSSTSQNITLTNTGDGALHVTSIEVNGFNANDFTLGTSSCLGTVTPAAKCLIPLTFAPLAAGIRTATLNITDDAADSPQTVALQGTATAAVTIGPAPSGSTSATVTAGQTAQFNLQITPGAGYNGTISFTYSGAPLGATIQGPSTLQISNGNAAPFMVSVITSGGSHAAVPFSNAPRSTPFSGLRDAPGLTVGVILLFLLVFGPSRNSNPQPRRLAFASARTAFVFLAMLGVMLASEGCGGGSTATALPPPVVTPQGQSAITITPSATSANGKPLQLQPIQLTLTVN